MSKNTLNTQLITLGVGTSEFAFNVTRDIFNKYTTDITKTDVVSASHNFIARSVTDDSKAAVLEFIANTPGSEVELAGTIANEYKPDIQIIVKKPKTKPSE